MPRHTQNKTLVWKKKKKRIEVVVKHTNTKKHLFFSKKHFKGVLVLLLIFATFLFYVYKNVLNKTGE